MLDICFSITWMHCMGCRIELTFLWNLPNFSPSKLAIIWGYDSFKFSLCAAAELWASWAWLSVQGQKKSESTKTWPWFPLRLISASPCSFGVGIFWGVSFSGANLNANIVLQRPEGNSTGSGIYQESPKLKFSETAVAKILKPLEKPQSDDFLMTQWNQRQKRWLWQKPRRSSDVIFK